MMARKQAWMGMQGFVLCLILLVLNSGTFAQSTLPGYRAPLLDTPGTPAHWQSIINGSSSSGPNQSALPPEIAELARGLRYDPGLIYKTVHDYVEHEAMWGDRKGAYMAWMDRSGNAFDQASLAIALLEEAVLHNTELTITNPVYVVGEVQLTAD